MWWRLCLTIYVPALANTAALPLLCEILSPLNIQAPLIMSFAPQAGNRLCLLTIYPEKVTKDSIRVLDLEPGHEEGDIVCNLRIVSSVTNSLNIYDAISYVWGDSFKLVRILCNGREYYINTSLALALKRIRHVSERRVLWADAICINQDDDEEKGHQVKQMGRIFQGASTVFVSLGPDSSSRAAGCFELIKDFNQHWGKELQRCKHPRGFPMADYPFSADPTKWQDIAYMSHVSWFDRLWVIQEAGLAKDCVVLWGEAEIRFSEIMETIQWLRCRPEFSKVFCPDVCVKWADIFLQNMCTFGNELTWRVDLPLSKWYWKLGSSSDNESFIEVLRTGRRMKATDPRDRVYGFLGSKLALTGDNSTTLVEPNYTKTVQEVYFDLATALLRHPREAPFLLGAVDHSCAANVFAKDNWPSWVPHWDQGYWSVPLNVPYNWYLSGGSEVNFTAHIQSNGLLAIHCIVFDELSWVSEVLSENNLNLDPSLWESPGGIEEGGQVQKCPIESLWEATRRSCPHDGNDLKKVFEITLCREYPASQNVKAKGVSISWLRREFSKYYRLRKELTSKSSVPQFPAAIRDSPGPAQGPAVRFAHKLSSCCNRRLAHTKAGRLVLAPQFAEPTDICCVVPGVSVPFIFRPSNQNGIYHLVGDCYIYGVMRGEIMQQVEEGIYKVEMALIK